MTGQLESETVMQTDNATADNVYQFRTKSQRLPHSIDAEQVFLGSLMLYKDIINKVPQLQPKHFYWPAHQRIFDIATSLISAGYTTDPELIKQRLPSNIEVPGGKTIDEYLFQIAREATIYVNAVDYGRLVWELYHKRQLIDLGNHLVDQNFDPEVELTIPERIAELNKRIDEIRQTADVSDNNKRLLLESSKQFVQDFIPPDYLVDGLWQRRFCYSLTGKTGAGKTAIALYLAAYVALGRSIGAHDVEKGRVLYFAGENPTDIRMRWIAMAQQMDFDIDDIDVYFVPGVYKISDMQSRVAAEIKTLGGVSLVIIDTSATYFEGDDENDNVQALRYAKMQRSLVDLPGGPTVVALCHPVKNAADENLLPRGGGSYLNEMDGNLTTRISNSVVELHWQGKYRGVDFAPISFQLKTVTHERLKDSRGRLIRTVVARHLSEADQQGIAASARVDEDDLLSLINKTPHLSLADYAKALGWLFTNGTPNKPKVQRAVGRLKKDRLVEDSRKGLQPTELGRKECGK
jgi:hypothetical protein